MDDYLIFATGYSGEPLQYVSGLPKVSILESENPRIWRSLTVYRMKSGDEFYNAASEFTPPHQSELDHAVKQFNPKPTSTK
ncbi:hypothetical protein P0E69_09370 [Chimaeribacter arupi]|uniref:hypothetical protein n=1 Tax=Chimaeribacter arupi TaxID=2060066 RepID=UPI0011AF902B|nr:hypothetical protein [Chimaeribacter arupi]WKZ94056.1 hypothetical protein P0E69_09370 [Chimaeribacter arupi]